MIEAIKDDKTIIERMKAAGIQDEIAASIKLGRDSAVIKGDELYCWCGGDGKGFDTGYLYFRSSNPIELLIIAARLLAGSRP